MKKITAFLTALALIMGLCACTRSATVTWQEQYDLGVRYLSEGNYREAIIAFTAAIEIDPKRANAYIGLADAYEAQGNVEQARQVLENALADVADPDAIRSRLEGFGESETPESTPGTTVNPTQEPAPTLGAVSTPESSTTPTPTPTPTSSATVIAFGDWGENLTWTLDNDGLLTVSGTGAMYDYVEDDIFFGNAAPWYYDTQNGERTVEKIKAVVIENGVTSIGAGAFWYCSNMTSITIPSSVASIGETAFAGCDSLTSVAIPDSVTGIGERAFVFCESLTSVTIPAGVTTIGAGAFSYCSSLTSINVASGNPAYVSVDGVLFTADQTLLHVYPAGKSAQTYGIPTSVTSIGDYAFADCDSLTSVTIPNSVTTIGSRAFYLCYNLANATIPDSVTTIKGEAFRECGLTSVTIPDSVTNLGDWAFFGCNSLTSASIGNSVTSIGYQAFSGCNLTSVTIPNSVTSIGKYAFSGCSSLTSVSIGNGVTTIDTLAFNSCDSLTDVYYAGSKAQWDRIDIADHNDPLFNATIHYNS